MQTEPEPSHILIRTQTDEEEHRFAWVLSFTVLVDSYDDCGKLARKVNVA